MSKAARRKCPRPPRAPSALDWARKFLGHYLSDEPCDFHRELMHDLECASGRMQARVAPRGHAKSTLAAFAFPLWCICEKKRRNIVIITHESSLATQFVRDIRSELETNEHILDAYGDLCVEAETKPPRHKGTKKKRSKQPARRKTRSRAKWAEAFFTTSTGITVQAKGSGASFRGARVGPQRPDLIICDDIEKDEHVESPEQRRKLERWLRRVVMPALAPGGRLLVLGSLIHYDSLLANLRDKSRFARWDYKVYRALEAELREDQNYYRIALWPDRWPVEKLDEERERVGTIAFEQEYMANPIDESLRSFRPEWLQGYEQSELVEERLINLMAVDPATGVSGGDFFAMWVGSVDQATGVIYTRALTLERIGIVDQVRRIVAAWQRWKPIKLGIETVAYQKALKDILDDHSRRERLYMPIVALQTTTGKRARIEGSSVFYENGTFRLPAKLDPEVEAQFLHFPKAKHDDAPDVCAMGIELARSLLSASKIEAAIGRSNPYARRGGW